MDFRSAGAVSEINDASSREYVEVGVPSRPNVPYTATEVPAR